MGLPSHVVSAEAVPRRHRRGREEQAVVIPRGQQRARCSAVSPARAAGAAASQEHPASRAEDVPDRSRPSPSGHHRGPLELYARWYAEASACSKSPSRRARHGHPGDVRAAARAPQGIRTRGFVFYTNYEAERPRAGSKPSAAALLLGASRRQVRIEDGPSGERRGVRRLLRLRSRRARSARMPRTRASHRRPPHPRRRVASLTASSRRAVPRPATWCFVLVPTASSSGSASGPTP